MSEKSSQGRREALIRLVKDRMVRPEYADSPSAMLVYNFFLSLLNVAEDNSFSNALDESAITRGATFTIYVISKNKPWSDDGTPEGIRRNILRLYDEFIGESMPRDRIVHTFIRNALHVSREGGCIQVDIAREADNQYVVTLQINFAPDAPEPAPVTRETKAESPSSREATIRAVPGAAAFSKGREGHKPVRQRLAQIVKARLAYCEQEAGSNSEFFCEAAECAVALQDRQAAQRLMERDDLDDDAVDIVSMARLAVLVGETELAREVLKRLEEGGAEYYEAAALIAAAIPEPQAALRLIPKLETEGLLRTAAVAAAKIGDKASAVRILKRAKDQGLVILEEKTSGAFAHLALFDTQLAREVMNVLASLAERDDLDEDLGNIGLYEAACIAMTLGERGAVRRIAERLQNQTIEFFAAALFGMLGELQNVQELMFKLEKEEPEWWKEFYCIVPVDISGYNLDAGFEVLRLLKRRGFTIDKAARLMLEKLYWMERQGSA